jgi:hypothetical protein
MTKFVLSTMTQSVAYTTFNFVGVESPQGATRLPIPKKKIVIRGGAGIPSARSGFGDMANNADGQPIWTAAGMVTPVSEENFEILKEHWLFKRHQEAGRVRVINEDVRDNYKAVKKEVSSMHRGDNFAQLTPSTVGGRVKASLVEPKVDPDGTFRL